jgi:hypothetical protein
MQVKTRDQILLNAQAKAEPAEDVITRDYYAQLPQIRLSGGASANPAAVWRAGGHLEPFGLVPADLRVRAQRAGGVFGSPEDRGGGTWQSSPASEDAASERSGPGAKPLLPRMPLPAHLRGRTRS